MRLQLSLGKYRVLCEGWIEMDADIFGISPIVKTLESKSICRLADVTSLKLCPKSPPCPEMRGFPGQLY